MPVPYSVADLKARFETGDVPTEQDFADLIDTINYWFQAAQTTANDAVTTANAAAGAAAETLFTGTIAGGGAAPVTSESKNIASIAFVGTTTTSGGLTAYVWRYAFTVAYTTANYYVGKSANITVTAQTATYIELYITGTTLQLFLYGRQ